MSSRVGVARDAVARKVIQTVKRWRLFDRKDKVLLGVSGGIDSVVLLHLLLHLPRPLRPVVIVAHFNHHLRGEQSDEECRFVEALCQEWGAPFHKGEPPDWRQDWRTTSNLQERARGFRYDFFKKTACGVGVRKILTAHQADDQAETFVIRWLQGAGLRGLSGISFKRNFCEFELIRPMLLADREEIREYAEKYRLSFREDPSNEKDDYLRSRVRKWLRTLQSENPRLGERTSLNAVFLQADQYYLESCVRKVFEQGIKVHEEGIGGDVKAYQALPDALRYRLIQVILREMQGKGAAFPAEAVLKVDELLTHRSHRKHYDLPKNLGLKKELGSFLFYRKINRR